MTALWPHCGCMPTSLTSFVHLVVSVRTRLVGRYRFGTNVSGFAISLGVSF